MKSYLFIVLIIFIFDTSLAQFQNLQNEKKVDPNLLKELKTLYKEVAKGEVINKAFIKKGNYNLIKADNNGRLLLNIRFDDASSVHQVEQMGCTIKTVGRKEAYIWIPTDKLESIAELKWVKEISYIPLHNFRSHQQGKEY
jgi:hypothetical protein